MFQMIALYRDPKGKNALKSSDVVMKISATSSKEHSCQTLNNSATIPPLSSHIDTTTMATIFTGSS